MFPQLRHARERLLGEILSQGPITGQREGQPHQLGVMALIRSARASRRDGRSMPVRSPGPAKGCRKPPASPIVIARAHEHPLREAQDDGKGIKAGHRPTGPKTSRAGLTLPAAIHRESLPAPSEADHPGWPKRQNWEIGARRPWALAELSRAQNRQGVGERSSW